MKNIFLMLGILFMLSGFSFGQNSLPPANPQLDKVCDWPDAPHFENTTTWGIAAGVTQGVGIHLRKWFTHHGFNVSLLPFIDISDDQKDVNLDLGLNYMYALWEGHMYEFLRWPSRNMVYSYVGGHFNYVYFKSTDRFYKDHFEERNLFLGGGLGLQMNVSAVQFHAGLGLSASRQDAKVYNLSIDDAYRSYSREDELRYALMPSFEIGVGYTFGWN